MTAREHEAALMALSDDELIVWHGKFGTDGLPRLKVERLLWLIGHIGRREQAPPRRLSPWEWQRLHEERNTIDDIEDETDEDLAAVERALRVG
jgi:hypothetical protein